MCDKTNEKRKKKHYNWDSVETPDLFGLYEFLITYMTTK